MSEASFQQLIEKIYLARDSARGVPGTLLWFVEEVGELVRAIRRQERDNLEEEFADVYAWLATLASLHGVDLEAIGRKKYGAGLSEVPGDALPLPHRLRLIRSVAPRPYVWDLFDENKLTGSLQDGGPIVRIVSLP